MIVFCNLNAKALCANYRQPRTYASPEREYKPAGPAARAAPADERGQVEELKVKEGYKGILWQCGVDMAPSPTLTLSRV